MFCLTEWATLETTLFATLETQSLWLKHSVSHQIIFTSFLSQSIKYQRLFSDRSTYHCCWITFPASSSSPDSVCLGGLRERIRGPSAGWSHQAGAAPPVLQGQEGRLQRQRAREHPGESRFLKRFDLKHPYYTHILMCKCFMADKTV